MHHAREEVEVVTVDSTESGAVQLRNALADKPEIIVRLVAGEGASDPALAAELAAVRKLRAEVELVPGVAPSTAVPAYAGLVPTVDWAMPVEIGRAWWRARGRRAAVER